MTAKDFNKNALDPDSIQRQASDPASSIWLTANAGTGKTKVLTDRVLRLLLDGNAPEDILCMTFTTAAAALMQKRIRKELSVWAICPDKELNEKLAKMVGRKPDVKLRNHARQLFARFLEAPEGIKIQTIHSLSQTLIQKFPIESGVPPSFKVMDAEDALALLRDAQAEILNTVQDQPNSKLAQAVKMITPEVGEAEFVGLVNNMVTHRKQFRRTLNEHGGLDGAIKAIYDYLETDEELTGGAMRFMMGMDQMSGETAPPDVESLRDAARLLQGGAKTDRERGEMLALWLDSSPEGRNLMFKEYTDIFLTAEGGIRKRLATKSAMGAVPALNNEAERLTGVIEAMKTANVARGTEALMILGDAVLKAYEKRKKALNYLDYDDLIHKTADLLQGETEASWVMRKMPGKLKHILVDEAQDTSPEQWQIVESLMTAFLNDPEKPKSENRTLFVVGDEKQSIFGFQGADPVEFARRKSFFEDLIKKSGGTWRNVDMDITFRSSPAILNAVDSVFARELAAAGVKAEADEPVQHRSFRQGQEGLVEVNGAIIGRKDSQPINPWDIPDEMEDVDDPALDLAERIADRVKEWLDNGETLTARGRAIRPDDIMILVRRRSSFLDHMVRALKKREIPVTGVDRMILNEQIAVKDMLALGETLLNRHDDYKLACVLKSPLIGLTDKQLETLAIGRKGSLWQALEQKGQSKAKRNVTYKKAFEYLSTLKDRLKDEGTYKFYSGVLMSACPANERSGLAAVYKRLGTEAEDSMVEFLNALERFERDHPPSLLAFINWLNAGEAEVKREIALNSAQPKVSLMTVHGAKGLEAPIVILPDTMGIPSDNIRARPRLLWPEGERKVPLWVPNSSLENKTFQREKALVEEQRDNEYRRLLYVAMTRAADRLYVFGQQNRENVRDLSWYSLMKDALIADENLQDNITIENEEDKPARLIYKIGQTAKPQKDLSAAFNKAKAAALPEWARKPPVDEAEKIGKFTPSQLLPKVAKKAAPAKPDAKALPKTPANDDGPSPLSPLAPERDDDYRFRYGDITHNLLEFLPLLPEDKRDMAAQKFVSQPGFSLTERQQENILRQVNDVLSDEKFGFIFGTQSRAEVTISGNIDVKGETKRLNGQIDRLVPHGDEVWIVDYKSNRDIPKKADDTPEMYLAQMAAYRSVIADIYPDKKVRCALLWTRAPKLQVLGQKRLDAVARKIGIGVPAPNKKTSAHAKAAPGRGR